jgi:RimJ/RimL family protein N-acetyltransferase
MLQFRPPERFETDTLLLRAPEGRDAQALFEEMLGDEETTRYMRMPRHRTREETLAYIEAVRADWESGSVFRWVMEHKETGLLAGEIQMQATLPRVEVGFMISRPGPARRRRASLDALRRLLHWTIAQPSVLRIFAYCAVDGKAHSGMERLGFTLEGRLVNHECRPNLGLAAGDSYLYAMTRPVAAPPQADAATDWLARSIDWEPA